jgi:hypothetical protein
MAIYRKPNHQLLYTPMTSEMKCPRFYLCLAHFHSNFSNVDATHAPTRSTLIWSTSYHHVIILVHRSWLHFLFTLASVNWRQVLLKLHRHTRSLVSKPPTCPSHLQPVCRAKSCLDLLHLDHMTQCHVTCAISSSNITCAIFATSLSHFYLHGICCSHTYTCGLITCVSHISPYKVVTQLPKPNKNLLIFPFLVINDNSTKIWKLNTFRFILLAQAILPCVNDFGQVPQPQIGSISSPLYMCYSV